MPESLALISVTFTGKERGKAIGTWSGFASISGAAGPVIGGYLAQTASWRWVSSSTCRWRCRARDPLLRVPESRDENAGHRVDWIGAVLATLGLGGLVYGLIRVQLPAGRADGTAFASAGVALLAAFLFAERRARTR